MPEETHHFFAAFQMTLGMCLEFAADFLNRRMLANGREYILNDTTFGDVIKYIVNRDQWSAMCGRKFGQFRKSLFV